MITINKKIKDFSVVENMEEVVITPPTHKILENVKMHENIRRPDVLRGTTYKIKSPMLEHAMYVTINDIILNEGTEYEKWHPFEIFINSKNMEQYQWIIALTRIMSAVFRKGGDVTFLVPELMAVFDPKGGYFKPGGIYMPSIVGEIGSVVERHLKSIGILVDEKLSDGTVQLIKEKIIKLKASSNPTESSFPEGTTLCNKCNTKALVSMDGCDTCLNCGYSKCG